MNRLVLPHPSRFQALSTPDKIRLALVRFPSPSPPPVFQFDSSVGLDSLTQRQALAVFRTKPEPLVLQRQSPLASIKYPIQILMRGQRVPL